MYLLVLLLLGHDGAATKADLQEAAAHSRHLLDTFTGPEQPALSIKLRAYEEAVDSISGLPDPPDDPFHTDDPAKHAEHLAMLALVPRPEATHRITSGVLPHTIPEGSKVIVPYGATVTAEGDYPNRLKWLRVDGTLRLNGAHLRVDTTVVDVTGWLDCRTYWHLTFADFGPVTDPMLLGRGLLVHGRWDAGAGTITSENPAPLHRGHVMVMHKPATTLDGVRITHCGRTDKSKPVTDFPNVSNQRGRYPLHFHRTGPAAVPIVLQNVTIEDSPGWGIVNHESNVHCDDCTCIRTFGAGYMAEVGSETGYVRNFTGIDIGGTDEPVSDDTRRGRTIDDWGFRGNPIWTQGCNIVVDGVQARGCRGGFVAMSNKTPQVPLTNVHNEAPILKSLPRVYPYQVPPTVLGGDIPLRLRNFDFRGPGLNVLWGMHNPSHHRAEQTIIGPGRSEGGFVWGYANRLLHTDLQVIGNASAPSGYGFSHTGIAIEDNFENCQIENWQLGVLAPTDGVNYIRGGRMANVVDILVTNRPNPASSVGREINIDGIDFAPVTFDTTRYSPGFNSITPVPAGRWHLMLAPWYFSFDIRLLNYKPATFWPELFHWRQTFGPRDIIRLNGRYVSYNEWAWDYPVPSIIPAALRLNPDGSVRTSGELYEATGLCLWGRVPIRNYERVPHVYGIVHDEPVEVLTNPPVPQ
jgi:hypothetical protein